MELMKNVAENRQISAFQLQSTREFGFMYDCVATRTALTVTGPACGDTFGLSDTNELTLGEYFYDIDHHT